MPRARGLGDQLVEVGERPERRVDVVEVGDVVAQVGVRRDGDRAQPDAVDPEPLQVVEPLDDPAAGHRRRRRSSPDTSADRSGRARPRATTSRRRRQPLAQSTTRRPLPSSAVIKYLGSKRRLVPVLGEMFAASGARTRARPVHRHDPGRAGVQAARRARHHARRGPLLRGVRPLLHRDRRATRWTSTRWPTTLDRLDALDGAAGLLHRDVLHVVALPAARERRAGRRDPRPRSRPSYRRLAALPGAAHQPDRGGRPGRLHRRRADGVPQAVGAAGAQPADAARARAARRDRHRASAATRSSWPARSARSTSRTSTRRTTSTATSRTTTCGRRWSRGTSPSTTASRASASTRATTRRRARSTASARCPTRCATCIEAVDAARRDPLVQRRELDLTRRARSSCARHAGDVVALRLRLGPLRRRADRRCTTPRASSVGEVSHLRNLEYVLVCGEPDAVERVTAPYADGAVTRATPTPRSSDRDPATTGSPPRA